MSNDTTAAILVGHGSIHSDSGKSMIRIATRLREQGVAPIVEAGFLNYNQPTLVDAVKKCKAQGATLIVIQPYFLIDGQYASQDLPSLVRTVAAAEPALRFAIGETLGYHIGMVQLAQKRILEADPEPKSSSALLFVAHGTPLERANEAITRVVKKTNQRLAYGTSTIAYLDCNQPPIPLAIEQLVKAGYHRLVVQPYFLHLGRHVRTDLPLLFEEARNCHPTVELIAAHHLDYDPLLVDVVAERIMSSLHC
ncbi:MAG: sirohydrochlorin chelatase [Caldilineaceae bacterium]